MPSIEYRVSQGRPVDGQERGGAINARPRAKPVAAIGRFTWPVEPRGRPSTSTMRGPAPDANQRPTPARRYRSYGRAGSLASGPQPCGRLSPLPSPRPRPRPGLALAAHALFLARPRPSPSRHESLSTGRPEAERLAHRDRAARPRSSEKPPAAYAPRRRPTIEPGLRPSQCGLRVTLGRGAILST
jgi:hypothetical protein